MSLRVNNLASFGGGSGAITVNITASVNDFVLKNHAAVAGAFASAGNGRVVRVFLSNAVIIGSTSTSTAGFSTGSGWGSNWTVDIIVASGSARIQGKGGVGGNGEHRTGGGNPFFMGGGGGGAGTQVGGIGQPTANPIPPGTSTQAGTGTATAGGTGGTCSTTDGTTPTGSPTAGGAGGAALEATSGGPNVLLKPAAGATLEVWGGGGGGGGAFTTNTGGAGGGPGLAGSAGGGSGGAGGAAGAKYSTPGAATITETGPGTIDDRGA